MCVHYGISIIILFHGIDQDDYVVSVLASIMISQALKKWTAPGLLAC